MNISIVIPVYNEENTILTILKKIKKVEEKFSKNFEVIVVNDASSDKTLEYLENNKNLYSKLINLDINKGKGNAINQGFEEANGEVIIIQDADLEYNPDEYIKLLLPFEKFNADVVYGSRFKSSEMNRVLFFWHSIANKIITLFSNILSDLNLTDVETGYKLFKKETLKKVSLEENRFGVEIELTHKLANLRPKVKIFEVGISYFGRTYEEGKKIGFKDAIRAIYCIIKYGLLEKFIKK